MSNVTAMLVAAGAAFGFRPAGVETRKVPPPRLNVKTRILNHFLGRPLGTRFSSRNLHAEFGSAFRSRVSDINRENPTHRIVNETKMSRGREVSQYWLEVKA